MVTDTQNLKYIIIPFDDTKMGAQSSQFYIWSRELESDLYSNECICELKEPNYNRENAFGCFKREVYSFCLNRESYHKMKCLYFYENRWRLIKLSRCSQKDSFILQFRNAPTKLEYDQCEECLGPRKWPLIERQFLNHFEILNETHLEITFTVKPLV